MLNPEEFRKIALSLEGTEERSHMSHPDFRVKGKIFASLAPDLTWGMAKLSPDQQADLIGRFPAAIKPASGKWGLAGATTIMLEHATAEIAGEALTLAWERSVLGK